MKNLNDLIKEINHFEKIISNMENPADIDAQNACMLFSHYLKSHFNEIKHQGLLNKYSQLTEEDIYLLEQYIDEPYNQWTQHLFQHCASLHKKLDPKNTAH
ncbi:MAG: hypothetical protein OQL09_03690 [Gammaproteobacteria bacterium]|nr:hypothetical protein [Gammaproteobacteria bacterium]